ncbi:hypothetical protein F5146DRAFT_1228935 [Armillaria mellea]|nr:hypothetical protein F5146DRAFT_1228935 [Armillaria mellea]
MPISSITRFVQQRPPSLGLGTSSSTFYEQLGETLVQIHRSIEAIIILVYCYLASLLGQFRIQDGFDLLDEWSRTRLSFEVHRHWATQYFFPTRLGIWGVNPGNCQLINECGRLRAVEMFGELGTWTISTISDC